MNLRRSRRSSQRLIGRDGDGEDIVRLGVTELPWGDLYHRLLTVSWFGFIGWVLGIYLVLNGLFAGAYWLGGAGAIANSDGSFIQAFFFSVQTMASIGYGAMYPQSLYANWLVVIEALVGLLFIAMATGVIFARFSIPTARIVFSHWAVVAPLNGVSTLMFRTANKRRNRILEAQLWVTLVRNEVTAEGEPFRRFYDLALTRSHTPLFALTWTAMHPIDRQSPLYGESLESLKASQAEIIVILMGIDETISQTIHARHSFIADEIQWDHQFVPILGWAKDGRRAIDYTHFHQVTALPPLSPLPQSTPFEDAAP